MNRLLVSVSVGALAALCSTTAMAQQASPERATTIDEVIITAQSRNQAVQDVGIALSVLSGESLTQQGVTNVNQLQNATPNLHAPPRPSAAARPSSACAASASRTTPRTTRPPSASM